MLVAPAEPARFDAEDDVPECALGVPSVLVASRNDPFMSFARAEHWARVWHSELVDLGDAGHVNVESGFGAVAVREGSVAEAGRKGRRRCAGSGKQRG